MSMNVKDKYQQDYTELREWGFVHFDSELEMNHFLNKIPKSLRELVITDIGENFWHVFLTL
jgi:hypothetical protein